MAIIRCKQGFHLYDNTKYDDNCPYCRPGQSQGIPETKPASSANQGQTPPKAQHTTPAWANQDQSNLTQSNFWGELKNDSKEKGNHQVDPVVGWLICIEGVNMGRDYRIFAGRNTVGREKTNRICITGDSTISREKQTEIIFEPNNQDYLITPGEGSNLTYQNGQLVLQPARLAAYDQIKMGQTMLLFIPLCNDKFSWLKLNQEKGETNES